MPRTVDEGFRDFLRRLTPSSSETAAAKRHRQSIERCIRVNLGLNRFWRTGSFGNGTSISGYSDVDYMASIPKGILMQRPSPSLERLREALDRRFPNTGVRTACPAILVPFGTEKKETTEITPAYEVGVSGESAVYDIPDCAGGWTKSSPDAHTSFVREVDQSLSHRVKPLVRFIKAWKYFRSVPVSSFYLELRVAKYASEESRILYACDVERILRELHRIGLARIQDPMGVSGYVSPCRTEAQLQEAKSKLATATARAIKAIAAQRADNTQNAFHWWNLLFDDKFPSYYR